MDEHAPDRTEAGTDRETFRARSSIGYAAGGGLVLAAWVWSAAVGGADSLVRALPWIVLVGLLVWLIFVRPRVTIDDHGIQLVNPLWSVAVPWAALIHVTTQFALTLHTPGARWTAWAAPGPGRHTAGLTTAAEARSVSRGKSAILDIGDLPTAPSGVAAHAVRERWRRLVESGAIDAGRAEDVAVVRSVAWGWVAAVGVCLAAGVLTAIG